jgi:hypothetical protein
MNYLDAVQYKENETRYYLDICSLGHRKDRHKVVFGHSLGHRKGTKMKIVSKNKICDRVAKKQRKFNILMQIMCLI